MIKVIVLKGGLGNQMFQYAFFVSLRKIHPLSIFLLNADESIYHHGNYRLDDVFFTSTKKRALWYRRICRYFPTLFNKSIIIKQKNSLEFDPQYQKTTTGVVLFDGYWQSEKYFINAIPQIKRTFKFKEFNLNIKTKEFAERLQKQGCHVSVHVRRGDYLNFVDRFGCCSADYYNRAISFIKEHVENPTFVFFSDDISWVKKNIGTNNSIYVDWNNDDDGWQDMYLMSKCHHNIVANSSFSWWGAWLNENKTKIIVAPQKWFIYSPNYDIIPSGWILL